MCPSHPPPMITAIHGLLGSPRDWDFLAEAGLGIDAITLDEAAALGAGDAGDTILGYSMGGRLALGALADGAAFRRAIIVSAGLNLEEGREARVAQDEAWASRFEADPSDRVIADWNAQPLFGGRLDARFERDFDRQAVAAALRQYSPGLLPPLRPHLSSLRLPVLWIAGEHDERYAALAREAVTLLPNASLWICPGAWHRVPWEQPEAFLTRVTEFLRMHSLPSLENPG